MSTADGDSGAYAYRGSSGASIALAAGGGLLAGVAAAQIFNHWGVHKNPLDLDCFYGSWSGTCRNCEDQFGAMNCAIKFSPPFDATRDDLMNTGFIPADYAFPILAGSLKQQ